MSEHVPVGKMSLGHVLDELQEARATHDTPTDFPRVKELAARLVEITEFPEYPTYGRRLTDGQ